MNLPRSSPLNKSFGREAAIAAVALFFGWGFQAVGAEELPSGTTPVLRGASPAPTDSAPSAKKSGQSENNFASLGQSSHDQSSAKSLIGWRAALAEGNLRLKTQELVPAEACFREAVRDISRDKSNSADDVVICLESLAAVLQTEDKTDEVIPLYRKSLRLLEKTYGKDSERTVATRVTLGDVFRNDSLYKRAANYYRPALEIVKANSGPSSLKYADIQHRLGLTLFKAGYELMAEKDYDSSLAVMMQQAQLPAENQLGDLLSDYIDLLRKSADNRRVASSDFQKELLKDRVGTLARTKSVGDSYWSKKVSINIYDPNAVPKDAQAKVAQGQAGQSLTPSPASPPSSIELDQTISDSVALDQINKQRVQFYERMIAIDINTLGPQHPSVARDLTGLAYLYLSQNKNDEAKVLLNRALQIYKSSYASDLLVKRTEMLIALIERGQQVDEKAPEFKNYVGSLPKIPAAAQNIEVSLRLNYLGLLCFSQGKIDEAERIYPWALGATALACGEQSSMAGSCLNDYALVLRRAGHKPEAEQFERTASSIVSRALAKQAAMSLP